MSWFGVRLSERLGAADRSDNFTLLRLFAAVLVIYGHGYALALNPLGTADFVGQYVGGTYTGSIGVDMFFFISGLFVTNSWLRRPDLMAFVRARMLRLAPGLACCLLLTVLVLGPLLTELALAEYFAHPETRHYLVANLKLQEIYYRLPGVFLNTHNPSAAVNGSLWSLPFEVACYVALAVFAVLGAFSRRWISNLCCALLALRFAGSWVNHGGVFEHDYQRLFPMFLLGTCCALNARWVPLHGGWLVLLILACCLSHGHYGFHALFGLTTGYFCLWLGYCAPLPKIEHWGDLSYGTYLYGYPIQQTLVSLYPHWTPAQLFFPTLAYVLPLAALSWYLVEKPAMALKRLVQLRRPPQV